MRNQIYFLLLLVLTIVVRSTSNDVFSLKGSSLFNHRNRQNYGIDTNTYDRLNDDYQQQSISRHNQYSPYDSAANHYRSRSRWPSSYEDLYDSNDWSRHGHRHGHNGLLSNFPGSLSPAAAAAFDNGPICHSLLDSQYPLFSDICGAVPQARYSLPNLFGHIERWQIAQVLTAILDPSMTASSHPSCTRSLRLLLCPLLFPPCPTRYEAPPVLPCQPFCRAIKNQCAAPALDLLPCDLLPPTSDLCPMNPTPYSSLLSSFGQPLSFNGGVPQSALSSILAQSALSQFDTPSSAFSPFFSPSSMSSSSLASLFSSPGLPLSPFSSSLSSSSMNPFSNLDSYMTDTLTPILVDFPPLPVSQDYRQAPRFFPATRSATEKV